MRVSVFGLGRVGCVTAACLADMGHEVIGVDVDPFKLEALSRGRAPFFEPGLDDLVRAVVVAGGLKATPDACVAVENSDLALVCVGTPTNFKGTIHTQHLRSVFSAIGGALRETPDYFPIALRSTVLPNVVDHELIPLLEETSGKKLGQGFGLVCNPEFLRQGSAIQDFRDPPWTVIGAYDARAGDALATLWASIPAPVVRTDPGTALMVKYTSNALHALKVAFANEIGQICKAFSVDGHALMDIVCSDAKLNISPKYLRPGFAFGGSCLRKDLQALLCESTKHGLELPVLGGVLPSNELHVKTCLRLITESGKRRIGLMGLTFKAGTDDLRDSAGVQLAKALLGKGYELRLFDPHISITGLHGANLSHIESAIPHVWNLFAFDAEELIRGSELVVVMQPLHGRGREAFRCFQEGQVCLDLIRALDPSDVSPGQYIGLSW